MKETSSHPILKALIPIAEGISKTIGDNCEVAIHDFSHPRHSILYVSNEKILGRKAGDSIPAGFGALLELAKEGHESLINYGIYENGHSLKCTKIFIKDENQTIIGCFCINIAIEKQLESLRLLEAMCETVSLDSYMNDSSDQSMSESPIEEIVKNIIINSYDDFKKNGEMDINAKKEYVQFLEGKGIFNVKGSIDIVADLLDVSRYTIYRYTNTNKKLEDEA